MQTALAARLKPDARDILGRRLMSKYKALRQAMEVQYFPARKKWRKYAEGDYSDRVTRDEASIYSKSNIPLEFITSIADFMAARTDEDIFGSEPFCAVIPQGKADKVLAEQLGKHFPFKLNEARFVPLGRQAVWRGFNIGEGIVKTTWKKVEDVSERLATVLMLKQKGRQADVLDENGNFIEAEDFSLLQQDIGLALWAKSPIETFPDGAEFQAMPDLSALPVLVDQSGPVLSAAGEYWFETDVQEVPEVGVFLCKSPIVQQTEEMTFEDRLIEERETIFEGLQEELVETEDFVFPLDVRHLSESDHLFHRLSLTRSTLRQCYGLTAEVEAKLGTPDMRPKNEDKSPKAGEGEVGNDYENEDPQYRVIECYSRIDIGNGNLARIYALVEEETDTIICCDYWANVVPQVRSPFNFIVPCPVPGRAYGRSLHEIYAHEADFIDRTFNSIIHRNKMHANPPGFVRSQAFKDGAVAKNFVVQIGKLHELNNDYTAKQALEFVEIPDLDQRTWQILELVMQMAQVRSGVTGAAQGAMTNLPANSTATGVQSIMLSGSVLHKLPIENVKCGFEDTLNTSAAILYANQNEDETFTYMEGDATELLTLNARSVKGLRLNIRLLLTRMHEREALDSAKAAIAIVAEYINNVPESEKDQIRPLFIQVLKSLRITGADALLRHANPPDPNAQAQPQLERFTESLNYKDVPEDIKRQMEVAAGYKPSTMTATAATEASAPAGPENAQ